MSAQVFHGIQHLDKIETAASVCFDTETLQLQPERGKLRLLQLGSGARNTVVLIDCFELDKSEWVKLRRFFGSPVRYWLAEKAAQLNPLAFIKFKAIN